MIPLSFFNKEGPKIGVVIIMLYFLPYFFFGEESKLLIHDNLDSNVVWVKMLLDSESVFNPPNKVLQNVMGGLPLSSVYATYDMQLLVFSILGVFYGYVVNKLLMSLVAFFGMYVFLKDYLKLSANELYIGASVAVLFALLPFWSFTFSVAALPFIFYAFQNLRDGNTRWYNWFIIVVYAFGSSLVLTGFFVGIVVFFFVVRDFYKNKIVNTSSIVGLVTLGVAYLISHLPLFYTFVFDNVVSHRLEFYSAPSDLWSSLRSTAAFLRSGQYHAKSEHVILLLTIIPYTLIRRQNLEIKDRYLICFIIVSSVFYGFYNFPIVRSIIVDPITSIAPIQLQRFHFLQPFVWYVLFASSLLWLKSVSSFWRPMTLALIFLQLAYLGIQHELIANRSHPTYSEFFHMKSFNVIKKTLNKSPNQTKVLSVGLHPSVAQYHGFATIDGYFPSYPLKYKTEFRKIIAGELERDEKIKNYFENWGSRCYGFSSEVGLNFTGNGSMTIDTLLFDFDLLRNMNVDFIVSAGKINTLINTDLRLVKLGEQSDNKNNVYFYEIGE